MPTKTTGVNVVELFVAPFGDDRAAGTSGRPLATIEGARRVLRRIRGKHPRAEAIVHLRGGEYRLTETVVFGLADGAATYVAAEGETPVITSDVAVGPWKKVARMLPGLPRKARGKVYEATMPEGLARFFTMHDTAGELPRAKIGPMKRLEAKGAPADTLRLPEGVVKQWANLADVEVRLCLSSPWSANVLPVAAVDPAAGTVRVGIPPTYPVNGADFERFGPEGSTYVENVFEGMTEAGTWVLDTKSRTVYLWPREQKRPSKGRPILDVVAPTLTEYIRVEGEVDFDGPEDEPVRGVVFRGLTFLHADRYAWGADHGGWGLQHDWELQDRPSAMLRFRGAEDCAVEGCRFAHAGASAVRLDLHCMRNRVAGNVMEWIGGCGVVADGYGPGLKDVNGRNEVVGNHIHHAGREYWHSPGVILWQSGHNRVANNLIHDMPYAGIVISSRLDIHSRTSGESYKTIRWGELGLRGQGHWFNRRRWLHTRGNVVEANEIHHVMERIFDGNAIYCSAVYGGTMIRRNFLHDCPSHHMQAGIRTDQSKDNARFIGNVIWRLGGAGIAMVPKGHNIVEHNVIAGMRYDRQEHWAYISVFHPDGRHARIRRNIIVGAADDHNAYLAEGAPDGRPVPALGDCDIAGNLYWDKSGGAWARRWVRAGGGEPHGVAADPMFVDAENGDFRLREGAPAREMGIKVTDLAKVGLRGC